MHSVRFFFTLSRADKDQYLVRIAASIVYAPVCKCFDVHKLNVDDQLVIILEACCRVILLLFAIVHLLV